MCMEYDRQLDTFISHDDIRYDSSIFEKFIDVIIIKLKILERRQIEMCEYFGVIMRMLALPRNEKKSACFVNQRANEKCYEHKKINVDRYLFF